MSVGPGEAMLLLIIVGMLLLIFGAPFVLIGVLTLRRHGGRLHRRAAVNGGLAAIVAGLALGILGYFVGASVGDESAGAAALALAAMGFVFAVPVYGVVHLGIWLFGRSQR